MVGSPSCNAGECNVHVNSMKLSAFFIYLLTLSPDWQTLLQRTAPNSPNKRKVRAQPWSGFVRLHFSNFRYIQGISDGLWIERLDANLQNITFPEGNVRRKHYHREQFTLFCCRWLFVGHREQVLFSFTLEFIEILSGFYSNHDLYHYLLARDKAV